MPTPTSAPATLRPDLGGSVEEFNLAADRMGFIGPRVMPVIEVAKQAGTFGTIPIEQLLKSPETKRAPGAAYNRGNWKFTPATFSCEEYGWEEPVDANEAAMYRDFFDAEMVSAEIARDVVLRAAEARVAAALFDAVTYSATTVATEWSNADSATPITDIETAVQTFWAATGLWPNALVINRIVFRNLRNCAQIIDRCKAQGFMDVRAGNVSRQQLAAVFDLPNILVAGSPKNTATNGSLTISPIWSSEYAAITRIAETNSPKEPCFGRTFHWSDDGSQIGGTMESYRREDLRADVIRCRHQVDEVKTYGDLVQLLDNITA